MHQLFGEALKEGRADEGTQALFLLSDLPTYSSATSVSSGESTTLWIKVDEGDGSTVTPPTLTCAAI